MNTADIIMDGWSYKNPDELRVYIYMNNNGSTLVLKNLTLGKFFFIVCQTFANKNASSSVFQVLL